MALYTYDPASILISIGGTNISGFPSGTFVEVSSTDQTWTMATGADGVTVRTKSNNNSGTLALTLQQTSPSNEILSGYYQADKLSNRGLFPVLITDLAGTTSIFAARCWIRQLPDITYSNEETDITWEIDMAEVDMFLGGNSETA